MASLFNRIKKDVQKGIQEGIAAVKEGASVVSGKMGELTAEGKRQYKMFTLKSKIQTQMTELGGRVYELLDDKKSLAADSKVKELFTKIKKCEGQLMKLEGGKTTKAATASKPPLKTKAAPKKAPKTAVKKVTKKTVKPSAIKK